jgi:hypothetical protein
VLSVFLLICVVCLFVAKSCEEFEDTKGVNRIRNSEGQTTQIYKKTDNTNQQKDGPHKSTKRQTTQINKDRQHKSTKTDNTNQLFYVLVLFWLCSILCFCVVPTV